MAVKIFGIVLADDGDASAQVIKRAGAAYEAHFGYNDTFVLVGADENTLSQDVAAAVGIKGENQIEGVSGFVVQLRGAYAGYTRRDLWEWLSSQLDVDA